MVDALKEGKEAAISSQRDRYNLRQEAGIRGPVYTSAQR
jgi:hypothetical protein